MVIRGFHLVKQNNWKLTQSPYSYQIGTIHYSKKTISDSSQDCHQQMFQLLWMMMKRAHLKEFMAIP